MSFKFLTNNIDDGIYSPSMEEIVHALSIGREAYLNGNDSTDNPFLTPALYEAFEEGWDLEHGYEILRQAQQRANDGF